MKLPFFRKPVHYTPPQTEGGIQDYRERILSVLLTGATTLGALAYVASFITALQSRQYNAILIYSLCYAWVLFISLQRRRLSSRAKSFSLLFLVYLLGVDNLAQHGLYSDASVILLAFVTLTSLLIGIRSGILALLVSLGTFGLAGVLIKQGTLVPPQLLDNQSAIDWITTVVVWLLLGTVLAFSLNAILEGLNASIAKVKLMVVDTDRDRALLRRHSQDLQRRLAQLQTVADIEHSISAMLEPKVLLQKVVDSLSERFSLYFVGIFLIEENIISMQGAPQDNASRSDIEHVSLNRSSAEVVLQTSSSQTVPTGYKMRIGGLPGMGWSVSNRKPRVMEVSGRKDDFIVNYLPMAHTEMTLPLLSHDRAIGTLMIYSTQSNAFDGDDIILFQSLADNLAIALENARLFQQTQNDLDEIRTLQRQYLSRAWTEAGQVHKDLQYTYQAASEGLERNDHENGDLSAYSTSISMRDQNIGQIVLETDKPAWTEEDRYFIESVVNEAALALDNARLLDETLRRSNHDRLIAELTRTVRSSTDIETILSTAIRELGRNLGASEAIITLNSNTENDGQERLGGISQ